MFTEERLEAIMAILQKEGNIKVKNLSEQFQVTEDCIRKDLKVLEKTGELTRTYGGAILSKNYPPKRDILGRHKTHDDVKEKIAQKALGIIEDNETIFLDISTINIRLAQLLAVTKKPVIVVSNMIDVLQTIAKCPSITAIGTGGIMHQNVNGFMGSAAIDIIRQYTFDRAFIEGRGVDMADHSISTFGVEDGLTKSAAIKSSRLKYIVMEKDKFYLRDSYKFTHFYEISGIITDEYPDPVVMNELAAAGVQLLI